MKREDEGDLGALKVDHFPAAIPDAEVQPGECGGGNGHVPVRPESALEESLAVRARDADFRYAIVCI